MSAKVKVEKVVEIMEEYLSCRPWEDRDDYWLEFHYNENYLKSGASIGELLYHKIYNVYNHYLRGKLSLEDEIEMTGDVFGYDKYKRYYYIWSMNTIFTRSLDYVILPAKDSSNKDVNLFSSELKWDDFNVVNKGEVMGTDRESKDYELLHEKIEQYILNEYYLLNSFQEMMKDNIESNIDIEPDIMRDFVDPASEYYVFKNLNGDDVYNLLDIKHSAEVLDKLREGGHEEDEDVKEFLGDISIKVDDMIRELYWDIHHTCYAYYDKFKKCREGKESEPDVVEWYKRCLALDIDYEKLYNKLSLNDFMICNDMSIEIVNNWDVYRQFGIEVDKYIDQYQDQEMER